jgi:hypothetical protein
MRVVAFKLLSMVRSPSSENFFFVRHLDRA